MHPFRAFLISFAAGAIALFGGYGAVAAMTPAPVGNTITV
jgi:Na+/glutamate symporter